MFWILRTAPIAALALALLTALICPGAAQGAAGGPTSSTASGALNPDALAVQAFLANPSSLLTAYPLGGGGMVSTTRTLVLTDLKTLNSLLTLASSATVDQKNAIGTGIGLAALVLLPSNPQAGALIQNALVVLNDQTILAAYAAVTGNQHLAAAGPGGGGGGSSGSAETSTSPQPTGGSGFAGNSLPYPSFATKNVPDFFVIPPIPTFTASTPTDPPGDPPTDPPTTVNGSVSPSTQ
jgi:hypothetical protein